MSRQDVHKRGARNVDFLSWDRYNQYVLVSDSIILCCGFDMLRLPVPWDYELDVGTCLVLASLLHFLYLHVIDAELFVEICSSSWRLLDAALLVAAATCQLLYVGAIGLDLPPPIPQVLNAIASLRALRIALHHRPSRNYLSVFFFQVGPLLMDFGALLVIVMYGMAVVGMELVGSHKLPASPAAGPDFNSMGSSMMSVFLIFVEEWQRVLYIGDERESGLRLVAISLYFIFCYIILGIGLCNLLTSVVVDFKKVLAKQAHKERREELRTKFKAAVRVIMTFNKLKRLSLAFALPPGVPGAPSVSPSDESSGSHEATPRLAPQDEPLDRPQSMGRSHLTERMVRPLSLPQSLSRIGSGGAPAPNGGFVSRTGSANSSGRPYSLQRAKTNRYIRSLSPETALRHKLTATEKQVRRATARAYRVGARRAAHGSTASTCASAAHARMRRASCPTCLLRRLLAALPRTCALTAQ